MNPKVVFFALMAFAVVFSACDKKPAPASTSPTAAASPSPVYGEVPGPLPENGFKAAITIVDAPAKLRVGQKQIVQVKIKNVSDVVWYARGAKANTASSNQFYLAAADRWLDADGQKLVTDMDGRYGLPQDLNPGEEVNVPLTITAPKDAGDYTLVVDLVQEQVAWFSDKGSTTAKAKISVTR